MKSIPVSLRTDPMKYEMHFNFNDFGSDIRFAVYNDN